MFLYNDNHYTEDKQGNYGQNRANTGSYSEIFLCATQGGGQIGCRKQAEEQHGPAGFCGDGGNKEQTQLDDQTDGCKGEEVNQADTQNGFDVPGR